MPTLTFRQKLWIPLCCSLLCIAAVFIADALQMRGVRMEERSKALREVNHAALSAVARIGDAVQAGTLTPAQAQARAQAQALAVVDSLRYGKQDYVSIIRKDGVTVQNPGNPASNGKNMLDFRDADGKLLFREFAALAGRGDGTGYIDFKWVRPGAQQPSAKLAYISTYRPWGWILLTGVYTDDIEADFRRSLATSALALALVSAVLVAIVVAVNRSLNRILGGAPEYAVATANRIAANDLGQPVRVAAGDNASLLGAMRTMQQNLAATITDIRASATTIATASGQIAAGNLDLSARTESQASALEETAASMEQLTTAVAQNADNAVAAHRLARSAAQVAQAGGDVIGQVTVTMGDISAASARIVDIIAVIDSIAFQTNILALNAAVEAARAGDQGRGFAVVAGEVRNLAQRSAAAAREVKTLIDDSTARVRLGDSLVAQAGSTMQQVVDSVSRMTDVLQAIGVASAEQRTGIGHINQAIGELDGVTQQNAALVEQAAAAAGSMQDQAGHLAAMVNRFRLAAADSAGHRLLA